MHLSDVVEKKRTHIAARHHTPVLGQRKKKLAVSRLKVEPWSLVEDCEEEKKKKKKGTVRPKCHHSVVRHHRPKAPR